MHESALIFVPAATFGQIIPKCETAPQPLQLPKRVEKNSSGSGMATNSF